MDWFLYDRDLRHERVNLCIIFLNLEQHIFTEALCGEGVMINHKTANFKKDF